MTQITNTTPPRRQFLRLMATVAAFAAAPRVVHAQPAASDATSAGVDTFDGVWRTVRDQFYDPHLHGLDWSAVRERYMPDASRAASQEEVAVVINNMLSELHASHTRYYTPDHPEYYQLADIFTGALRRRGLERAFPGGGISYPGVGVLLNADVRNRSIVTGVIDGTPAQQAELLFGDEILSADRSPFEPVRSFRDKVGKPVVLALRRSGTVVDATVTPVDIEPNKMFLDGMNASARIVQANGRRIGYVHVWSYASYAYQRVSSISCPRVSYATRTR